MKINFFAVFFALLVGLLSLAIPAHCQSQAGSVAIAAAIRPEQAPIPTELGDQAGSVATAADVRSEGGSELDEFARCVLALRGAGASFKEASKDCREYRKVLAKESTRIANEAADATKASRPLVIPYYGYRSYDPRRTVIVRQAPPPRKAPPSRREAPPRRPAPSRDRR